MKSILRLLICFIVVSTIGSSNVSANSNLPETRPENLIYDPNNYLNDEVDKFIVDLNTKSKELEFRPEVGILIVDTLNGQNIKDVANKVAKDWKIGFNTKEDKEYGLLVVISVNEKKIRSESSNNMLNLLDSSGQELTNSIKPYFKNEDYSGGVLNYLKLLELEYNNYYSVYLSQDNSRLNNLVNLVRKNFTSDFKMIAFLGIPVILLSFLLKKIFTRTIEYTTVTNNTTTNTNTYYSENKSSLDLDNSLTTAAIISSVHDSSSTVSDSSSSFDSGGFDGGGFDGGW